jgi:aryl-alcohol dehydrogenase-like predicted oxidoreductase
VLVPAAVTAGAAVIARAPLADGALAGEVGPGLKFWPGDERAAWTPAALAAIVPEVAALCAYAREVPPAARSTEAGKQLLDGLARHPEVVHRTVADLALAFVTGAPGVTAALVGARSIEHARAAVEASARYLVPALPAAIRAALTARSWGDAWYRPRTDVG